MEAIERQKALQTITQRLVIFTSVILLLVAAGLYVGHAFTSNSNEVYKEESFCIIKSDHFQECSKLECEPLATKPIKKRSFLVLLVFTAGLLGGFVSIQQRLPSISSDELSLLSSSWVSVTIIPINGGIFALVLMLCFVGGIIQGELFPVYHDVNIHGADDFSYWLSKGYPKSGADVGKLLFWSFVSGFSERLVPQIIRSTSKSGAPGK